MTVFIQPDGRSWVCTCGRINGSMASQCTKCGGMEQILDTGKTDDAGYVVEIIAEPAPVTPWSGGAVPKNPPEIRREVPLDLRRKQRAFSRRDLEELSRPPGFVPNGRKRWR